MVWETEYRVYLTITSIGYSPQYTVNKFFLLICGILICGWTLFSVIIFSVIINRISVQGRHRCEVIAFVIPILLTISLSCVPPSFFLYCRKVTPLYRKENGMTDRFMTNLTQLTYQLTILPFLIMSLYNSIIISTLLWRYNYSVTIIFTRQVCISPGPNHPEGQLEASIYEY